MSPPHGIPLYALDGVCDIQSGCLSLRREFLMEVSDPTSPGAKPTHERDPTVPTLGQHRPLITLARRLLEEV